MKYLKITFLLFILSIFTTKSFAVSGCYYNGAVYQTPNVINLLGTFYDNPLSPSCGNWTPTTGTPCTVCLSWNTLGLLCLNSQTGIYSNNFQLINCNLDDYTWSLGLGAGVFGFILIRRKNKC